MTCCIAKLKQMKQQVNMSYAQILVRLVPPTFCVVVALRTNSSQQRRLLHRTKRKSYTLMFLEIRVAAFYPSTCRCLDARRLKKNILCTPCKLRGLQSIF